MLSSKRNYSFIDNIITGFDKVLDLAIDKNQKIKTPADNVEESHLLDKEIKESIQMMRINHSGEVCAQALYYGQAFFAVDKNIKSDLLKAGQEEKDHLDWCKQRLIELNGKTSILNPLLFVSSFAIGASLGKLGDKWSLGFLAETENQVTAHLDRHLNKMSPNDKKSRVIIEQMKIDEIKHANQAIEKGGVDLPTWAKKLMNLTSKFMTKTTKYI